MRFTIITGAMLLVCVANVRAIAAPVESTRIVRTADLDLTRHHDRAILDDRIAAAIGEVCGAEPRVEEGDRNSVIVCRAKAFQSAGRQRAQILSRRLAGGTVAMIVSR